MKNLLFLSANFHPKNHQIFQVGGVVLTASGELRATYNQWVDPGLEVPGDFLLNHRISRGSFIGLPEISEVGPELAEFSEIHRCNPRTVSWGTDIARAINQQASIASGRPFVEPLPSFDARVILNRITQKLHRKTSNSVDDVLRMLQAPYDKSAGLRGHALADAWNMAQMWIVLHSLTPSGEIAS